MRKSLPILLACLLAPCLSAETLKVMSFNVRYPNPGDGEDAWPVDFHLDQGDLVAEVFEALLLPLGADAVAGGQGLFGDDDQDAHASTR